MECGRSPEDPGSASPGSELQADCHTREAQQKPSGDESPSPLDPSDARSGSAGDESTRDSDRLGLSIEDNAPENNAPMHYTPSTFFNATTAMAQSVSGSRTAQKKVQRLLNNHWTEIVLGGVITLNFLLILLETDSRAWYPGRGTVTRPRWSVDLEWVCLAIFGTELALRIFADGRTFHLKLWNVVDTMIIAIGVSDFILSLAGIEMGSLSIIRVLRLCRLLRLLRVLQLFTFLKELRRLIQMMGGCFKTLFWSSSLLFLLMTIWAVIAVELINPTVQEIADEGGWQGCERCRRSFASVFMADITLFQTVVAGDSWGYIAIPVIEKNPPTAIIFIGALMTLVFGVLNLIVAVIVDVFAQSRDKDVYARATEMEEEERDQKAVLGQIFKRIDSDGGGTLSYAELVQGACKEPEFQRWLRVMDIDSRDLQQLFSIVDEDSSGEIDPAEFIEAMYRMRTADSKTAIKFVKHIVSRMDEQQKNLQVKFESNGVSEADTAVCNDIQELSDKLDKMAGCVTADSKTAIKFVKHIVSRMDEQQKNLQVKLGSGVSEADTAVCNDIQWLSDKLDEMVNVLTGMGVHSGIHELNGKFDKMFGVLPEMGKFEGQLQAVLLQQERHIRDTIEAALRKAAEVALEADKWAAKGTTPSIGVAGVGHNECMVPLPINHMPPAAIHEGELPTPQKQVVSLVGQHGPSGPFSHSNSISAAPHRDDVPSQATPQGDDQARGSQPSVRI
eukprot:CAMPEP_0204247638 /NCGR_PEP_ID=MMETSP0361-20130328/98753_1 /ASSEMBLY_ACC=CAM_ASM_000343 /TAXON_ID=268821 /ORGANISM="Scrippsiella Hangoei, Strain SHTV-5" /LENGTH=730 /DNA_ID=CAMNT_0051220881 /DNA_START=21 /DNA_END=2212 /DNA_ORIENTATION=-